MRRTSASTTSPTPPWWSRWFVPIRSPIRPHCGACAERCRPWRRQPPRRGARAAPRSRGRAPARRTRTDRRTAVVVAHPSSRGLAGAAVPPLAIEVASALHYFGQHRLRPSGHQAEQHHHGCPGAPDRPVGGPDRPIGPPASRCRSEPTPTWRRSSATPRRSGIPGTASDVWGLGATLFHAVAGYRPFDDGRLRPPNRSSTGSRNVDCCPTSFHSAYPTRWRRSCWPHSTQGPASDQPPASSPRTLSPSWLASPGHAWAGSR